MLLVKVHAASVNPLDWHYLRGEPYIMRMDVGLGAPKDPRIGVDFSGTVAAVGSKVTRFKPGDEVFGGSKGSFAEYLRVREGGAVAPKPANVSHAQAAAMPIAAVTALQALRDQAQLKPGQKVLVNGASGGVGTYAVQIAKAMKLHVTATASGKNADFVRSLGADAIVDYTAGLDTLGPRFDVVFDAVDKLSFKQARRLLKPGGVVVSTNPLAEALALNVLAPFRGGKKLRSLFVKPSGEQLREIAGWIGELKVRPQVERTFPLASADEAHRVGETGRTRGKLVLIVDDAPSHRPATSA